MNALTVDAQSGDYKERNLNLKIKTILHHMYSVKRYRNTLIRDGSVLAWIWRTSSDPSSAVGVKYAKRESEEKRWNSLKAREV